MRESDMGVRLHEDALRANLFRTFTKEGHRATMGHLEIPGGLHNGCPPLKAGACVPVLYVVDWAADESDK